MAAFKKDFPKEVKSILPRPFAKAKAKAKPHLGDVNYYQFPEKEDEPFRLYFEGNQTFAQYDYIPLTVMELRQKIIIDAAEKFRRPVWFDFCIDDEGTFLPFAMVTDRFPGGLTMPVILNAEVAPKNSGTKTWRVIVRTPLPDSNGYIQTLGAIRYARGHVLDADTIWEEIVAG